MPDINSFPKIDAHVHYNADRPNLLDMARQFNFSLVSINTEVPDFPSIEEQRQLVRTHNTESDIPLYHATTVSSEHIFSDGWAESAIAKIKNDLEEGAIGVKFWKNIGMSIRRPDASFLMPDDPELKPVFTFLEEEQIPVLGHQGEPKNCWLPVKEMTVKSDREYFSAHPEYHMYNHDEYPGYWDHIKARDALLDRHPHLRFVGLHLASLEWNLDEVASRLERYPNLAVDLAERITHLYYHAAENRQRVIDFFEKYQDRIIYGTDIINDPGQSAEAINRELERRWTEHWTFLTTNRQMHSDQFNDSFKGLELPESILKKIYRLNAVKWYNL
jgi:predicted TIM-barrel fold metal-dependent hydrolase